MLATGEARGVKARVSLCMAAAQPLFPGSPVLLVKAPRTLSSTTVVSASSDATFTAEALLQSRPSVTSDFSAPSFCAHPAPSVHPEICFDYELGTEPCTPR